MSWKILRILTTDTCNYHCLYCHNEGQTVSKQPRMLSLNQFKFVMEQLHVTEIQEVRFSGGEPLMNEFTVDMIEWVDANTNYEVGLATNGSLLTENLAQRLSKTRVMVTLHLPSQSPRNYRHITGGELQRLKNCIALLEKYKIDYSFNYVLYPKTINNLDEVLNYSLRCGKRIKLLPYIERGFKNFSAEIMKQIDLMVGQFDCVKEYDENNGITWWKFVNGAVIKMIDSPCYERSISKCRNYAELRLLPDLRLQSCIFGTPEFLKDADNLPKKMDELWLYFNSCPRSQEAAKFFAGKL